MTVMNDDEENSKNDVLSYFLRLCEFRAGVLNLSLKPVNVSALVRM